MSNVVANFQSQSISEQAVTAAALTAVALPQVGSALRLTNRGPNACYVRLGADSSVAAALPGASFSAFGDFCVLNGQSVIMGRSLVSHQFISAICKAAETAALVIEAGEGAL